MIVTTAGLLIVVTNLLSELYILDNFELMLHRKCSSKGIKWRKEQATRRTRSLLVELISPLIQH